MYIQFLNLFSDEILQATGTVKKYRQSVANCRGKSLIKLRITLFTNCCCLKIKKKVLKIYLKLMKCIQKNVSLRK